MYSGFSNGLSVQGCTLPVILKQIISAHHDLHFLRKRSRKLKRESVTLQEGNLLSWKKAQTCVHVTGVCLTPLPPPLFWLIPDGFGHENSALFFSVTAQRRRFVSNSSCAENVPDAWGKVLSEFLGSPIEFCVCAKEPMRNLRSKGNVCTCISDPCLARSLERG